MNEKTAKYDEKAVAAVIMALGLITIPVGTAHAAETEDHTFNFNVAGQYTYTAERPKTNTTSVYVKVDYNKPSAYIQTYGYAKNNQGNYQWLNLTEKVTTVTARPSQPSSIHTLIYERGGRKAKLRGRSIYNSQTSTGVWSPDSTRNYTFLN